MRSCNQFTWAPPVRKIGNKLNTDLLWNGTFPTVLAHWMGNISWWDAHLIHILCFTTTKDFFQLYWWPLLMQITILFTSMLATLDQMGTVAYLRTVPLEKLSQVNVWIYQDQRDFQDTQRGVPYPTALWQMRHSPSGWISCNPTPHGKKQNRLAYDKSIFNYRLSRARRIVENTFGILAQRFRVFDRRIHMDDHSVIKIVNATCVLHNHLCTARMDVAKVMGFRFDYLVIRFRMWIAFKLLCVITGSPHGKSL